MTDKYIVAIDDSEINLNIIAKICEYNNIPIETATSGKDGISKISSMLEQGKEIACVLLDIMMPEMSGLDVLKTLKEALVDLRIEPYQLTIVSGIGQASKLPHYMKCHTFNGLHGRTLPVATGIRLANHEMLVIAVAGDGGHGRNVGTGRVQCVTWIAGCLSTLAYGRGIRRLPGIRAGGEYLAAY